MICVQCQTPLPDGSRFCNTCGADLSDPGAGPRTGRERTGTTDLQERLQAALEGRYRIKDLLGRGGMGAVFLATDVALDREVAIKLLPPDIAHDENLVKRFEHEARTAAKLDHANIMPIYAVEGIGDLHFFVMKYVAGRSLEQVLESGPPPFDVTQQILWEAACALGHAHGRGFVHRDIKPANFMLDENGRVMLADFGISKALQSASQFTATGQVIGTPHYMSPEQAKGTELDGRSDQYSLGIVGYRMLSGRLPFEEDSVHTVLYKHIYEPPPPVEQLRPETPDFLATAIRRALNKDPDDRFPTMEDFATAVLPEHPVTAGRKGRVRISVRPSASAAQATQITPTGPLGTRRRRWPAVLAGLVMVGIGSAGAWRMMGRAGPRPGAAGAAAENTVAVPPVSAAAARPETTRTDATPPAPAGPESTQPERRPLQAPPRTVPTRPAAESPPPAPAVGFLTVDATPFGTVFIDKVEVGDTPVSRHALPPGRHIVEIQRVGYRSTVDTVTVTAGNTTIHRKALIREP